MTKQLQAMTGPLLNNFQIAKLFSISRSWVRKQRRLRRHNQPHVFTVDPIYIGTAPRYPEEDVANWVEARRPKSAKCPPVN